MPPLIELIDQETTTIPQFTLECGATLKQVPVAYKTWGKLNDSKDNVMIICHAFTGSADVEDWCVPSQHTRLVLKHSKISPGGAR